jgi:hypothetical protein
MNPRKKWANMDTWIYQRRDQARRSKHSLLIDQAPGAGPGIFQGEGFYH